VAYEDYDLEGLPTRQSDVGPWEENWTPKKNFHLTGSSRRPHTATSKEDYFDYWYDNNKNGSSGSTVRKLVTDARCCALSS
jgi:hypothetical protein